MPPQVEAASGVNYSDGRTMLWTNGEEALVEVGGQMLVKNCRPVH